MKTRQELTQKIERYCLSEGISATTLSVRIFGQWRILNRFMGGGDITLSRAEETLSWIKAKSNQKGAA